MHIVVKSEYLALHVQFCTLLGVPSFARFGEFPLAGGLLL